MKVREKKNFRQGFLLVKRFKIENSNVKYFSQTSELKANIFLLGETKAFQIKQ